MCTNNFDSYLVEGKNHNVSIPEPSETTRKVHRYCCLALLAMTVVFGIASVLMH